MIDSHCHFDAPAFDTDRKQVFERAKQAGVSHIISPAVTADSWQKLKKTTNTYTSIYPCYGLHPMFIEDHRPEHIEILEHWIENENPIAIGEIGLDYYLPDNSRENQQFYFNAQLDIAAKHRLPVIIHARKSTEHVLQALKKRPELRGIIHSYSGSFEQARELIKRGFLLGLGGPVTWSGSRRLHKLVQQLPLDAIVLETDAPDQTGERHKGERNEPAYLVEIASKIAQLKGISVEEVQQKTTSNCHGLFDFGE